MAGSVGQEELQFALSLESSVKVKFADFERAHWAADLNTPPINTDWKQFISQLEHTLANDTLDDQVIIKLINYLSTIDTAELLWQIGRLSRPRQVRFLYLLNWLADKDEGRAQVNALRVRDRLMMSYRLKQYPRVYATERLERAIQVISQHGNFGN
jgi:hypothetical protein